MSYPSLGLYGPEGIADSLGNPLISAPVTITQLDTTTASTIYPGKTRTGGVSIAPQVYTDSYGNLSFWAEPGQYILGFTAGGSASTKTIEVLPYYGDLPAFLPNTSGPQSGTRLVASTTIPGPAYFCQSFSTLSGTYVTGGITLTFAGMGGVAFPNAIESLDLVFGDFNGQLMIPIPVSANTTVSGFKVKFYVASTGAECANAYGTQRLNVTAWGS